MSETVTRTPAVGDPVVFEGLAHTITRIEGALFEIESELRHGDKPRFRTVGNLADCLWSSRLGAWYVWGRVLCKGRGGVGMDQRQVIAELRDHGVIPSRPTRERGQGPAAGEQHGLYCDLVAAGVDWTQELGNLRRGEGLSDAAKACCAHHEHGFRSKRLNHGYATPNDGDPGFAAAVAGGT